MPSGPVTNHDGVKAHPRRWRKSLAALTIGLAGLMLSPVAGASPAKSSLPVTIFNSGDKLVFKKHPSRIISLSPTATEMLFAEGAGSQVIAVDSDSDYPPSAPRTTLSGYTPNVEAIAKYRPDLVVISYDPSEFEQSLKKLKIPVLMEPAANDLSDTYNQIDQLGRVTGHLKRAEALVTSMKRTIRHDVEAAPHESTAPTYYYELDQTYYSATSKTFIGRIFSLFGMKNIADQVGKNSNGYPQLSSEYILKSDPEFIFLADTICCGQSAATVAKRPGWSAITAVRRGDIVALNDDIASRWGPRIVILVGDIEKALWKQKRS